MQFVKNGPDIPDRLLQAHEEGRVVFFCGAGISYPAGLPGFSGLVERLFDALGVTPDGIQIAAIKAKQFDTAIGLLENSIVGHRDAVRTELANILTPNLSARGAMNTHEALLTLSRCRDGRVRLITTNFDRLFEEAIARNSLEVARFKAPLIPVPKNRWNGLVYLHGLIPEKPTLNELNRLVVASGDFGLAYLTERWAARFVGELFRSYSVCFVGYSIDDPVLRYMMDALAADRLLGEAPPEMYAFGSSPKGQEETRTNEWRAKNVTPILYRESKAHSHLHRTLQKWADVYRDGVSGKERIVAENALAVPMASTEQDDFVGRLLWAISDGEGLPAKRFAELDPVPSLDWLGPLCEDRYKHSDLRRFRVFPESEVDEHLAFSIANRPPPYRLAPRMMLVRPRNDQTRWDKVMFQLARWLTRHLDDPKLVLWVARHGGTLHDQFIRLVEDRLDFIEKLEGDGNQEELDRIKASAQNSIPRLAMRTLWRMILSGRVKARSSDLDLYGWAERLTRSGLTTILRLELRELLTPCVLLRNAVRWGFEADEAEDSDSIKSLVDWDIVLSVSHPQSTLAHLRFNPLWTSALPELLSDFSSLLQDALDLMRELGGATQKSDLSFIHHPSISGHGHNSDLRSWTTLVELTRDAWMATASNDVENARLAAERWWKIPYPVFKRLAFFAAAQENCISPSQSLEWLLSNEGWWLWSSETKRESIRLLTSLAPRLNSSDAQNKLEEAILAGLPKEMALEGIDPARWKKISDQEVWLRLAKLDATGISLGATARDRLAELSSHRPHRKLAEDERDEFPIWTGGGRLDSDTEFIVPAPLPGRRREVVDWLKKNPTSDDWHEDGWRVRCRDDFPPTSCALIALANEDIWLQDRWREALQVWSDQKLLNRSWRYMGPILANASDSLLKSLGSALSNWIRDLARVRETHEEVFFQLCQRILSFDYEPAEPASDPVFEAINHPVGHVTDALLIWWHRGKLEDKQGLPDRIRPIFSKICNTGIHKFYYGRVMLAAHVIALFRVDYEWTSEHLLPFFEWQTSSVEALGAWTGFLGSPRLFHPLLEGIKEPFLQTARHYDDLGRYDEQYAALLTLAALDLGRTFSVVELREAFCALPLNGLQDATRYLGRFVEGAGEQREAYWRNRVSPMLQKIWPKSHDRITPEISESMADLCIAANEAFIQAMEDLRHWLKPQKASYFLMHRLKKSGICITFPDFALEFLDLTVSDHSLRVSEDLGNCLQEIKRAQPSLADDLRYRRLVDLSRSQ